MGLPKGRTNNPKGKPKGAKGKKTEQWEALADSITGQQAEKFQKFMDKLWKSKDIKEQSLAADLFIKTVEYFKPKQARVESIVKGDLTVNSIKFEDAEGSKD
jgi:hypothetical protein